MVASAPPGSRYVDQLPHVLPPGLDELRGPGRGCVTVDRWTVWSGRSTFDLEDDRQVAVLYETVLREATASAQLAALVDRATLVRLWPHLVLPPHLRARWETRFPELDRARPAPA